LNLTPVEMFNKLPKELGASFQSRTKIVDGSLPKLFMSSGLTLMVESEENGRRIDEEVAQIVNDVVGQMGEFFSHLTEGSQADPQDGQMRHDE